MLTSIAALSYGIAAVAFSILAALLMTEWRARLYGTALAIASLLTVLWSATVAYHHATGHQLSMIVDILEIVRDAAWTIFLLILMGPFLKEKDKSKIRLKASVITISAFYALLFLAIIYSYWNQALFQGGMAVMNGIVARLALAIIGMLLVEQYYRNSPAQERWGIKFFCLGVGGMFAYDFYLYSNALMFRQLDTEIWAARGLVNALIVPLIAASAARNPAWSLGVSVSRSMFFHSTTLFGSAIYLLLMSAAGYYLRIFGGNWGAVMQPAFLFAAVILLAGILFSGASRSWLKVFISKHFYNYNYDYREEWLRFTRTLSKDEQRLGERSIQAVAALVESPGGLLFIKREAKNCEAAAYWNMTTTQVSEPVNSSFCHYLETSQWVIDLQEYGLNPQKYGEIHIPQWLKSDDKAWLVVPMVLHGSIFGFIVLAHPRSKIKLNWEVIDLLKIAGSQAASYLAQEESSKSLMVARQFESFNRMSTFMVHDLKNLISQLSLLLSNSEKHRNNPEFQKDMLDTLDLSVQKMKLLLHKLSREASTETIPSPLPIAQLLQHVVELKSAFEPKPELEISDSGLMIMANQNRLERVIGHLIQNAIEATPREGKVKIRIKQQKGFAHIEIKDTGHGMSEVFIREKLYKPFKSTKSAEMGIGAFESREYIHELGGQLEVASIPAAGTTFQVILPLHKQDNCAANPA